MQRILAAATLGIVTVLLAPAALAQPLGQPLQVALGAERLFGFSTTTTTEKQEDGTEDSISYTEVGLLGQFPSSVYQLPRLAVDVFPIQGLSLGGTIGYSTTSTSLSGGGRSEDGPTMTMLIVSPRVGYALMFSDVIGIWPRVGFSYSSVGVSQEETDEFTGETTTVENTNTDSAVTVEAMLVISPAAHAAITLGPTLDVGVGGTTKTSGTGLTDVEHDETTSSFGIQAGLAVYF